MTIGIDIDDTITETTKNANALLKEYDPSFQGDYHKHPNYEEYMALYRRKIMLSNPLKPGVKEAFDYFKSKGDKIVIITYRPDKYVPDVNEVTLEYLKEQGLSYDILINTYEKGKAAEENGVDIYIDDKIKHLDDVSSYGIECIHFSAEKGEKYPAFNDWADIVENIESRRGEINGKEDYNTTRARNR